MRTPSSIPPLTDRELTCLQWAAIGKTSSETGVILNIAERTVNSHLYSVCNKLGVHRRQAAITLALNAGLVPGFSDPRLCRAKTRRRK